MSIFAAAPFLGPVLGPIIGGFLGMKAGWRWVMGFLAAFSGALWILGSILIPETYAPVLLRRRAAKMSKMTGKVYVSKIDFDRGKVTLIEAFKTALSRPWILLLKEPIVFLLSIYMAIIYGTLYMLFGAFPIVYEQDRGWNQGVGGLAFLGIMVGMLCAIIYTFPDNKRYIRIQEENDGFAPPEARLPPALVGSIAIPIGLFWFAWTNSPNIHWIVSILAGVPFGFGMVLVFLSVMNYLIDAYTIFAASVLAANSVLRSCFGAAFPLFTTYMYSNLGIHWASTVPAFLALACVPFPFLFYKYGASIRERCKFAGESAAFIRKLMEEDASDELEDEGEENADAGAMFDRRESGAEDKYVYDRTEAPAPRLSASSDSDSDSTESTEPDEEQIAAARTRTASSTRTGVSMRRTRSEYDGNPYDIDRVNTRQSDFSFATRKR